MSLEKAQILVLKTSSIDTIDVMFNPNEYSIESGNQYSSQKVPGLQAPIAQFISGDASTLSMDLFFDSYESGEDVRSYTAGIFNLLAVDSDLHAPPICRFVWGSLNFKGYVEKVSQRFTMFLDSGIPVRATLKVTFKSYQTMSEQYQNIPRQSSDRTKQKIIKQGEQLWMLANEEYENSACWRNIADANDIDNPRKLEAGRRLVIPPLGD